MKKKKLNILIIEDDEVISQIIHLALQETDAALHFAATIKSATQILESVSPDLAIIDVGLPDGNGLEFSKQHFSVDGNATNTAIIFLTGRADKSLRLRAFTLNTIDYITKPFSVAEFTLKIENLLRLISRQYRQETNPHLASIPANHQLLVQKLYDLCLEKNGDSFFNIDQAADSLNVSVRTLQRVVKERLGKNFSAVLYETRMTKAKALLEKQYEPKRVAGMCGYKHPENFFTAFRRAEAMTPRDYQKSLNSR